MLPLWIIDITTQSNRQGAFKHLVGQVGHVIIAKTQVRQQPPKEDIPREDSLEDDEGVSQTVSVGEDRDITTNVNDTSEPSSNINDEYENDNVTTKEKIEEEDKRAAQKNAIIKGNYWYYSHFSNYFEYIDKSNAEAVALCLYDFQSDLVREGQRFIDEIRKSNVKPYQTINVMVLGDSTEELTRIVFPSIATILQKEKGRIVPHHIHQGMEIMGMLFIPCDVNSRKVDERVCIQRTLTEIQVQHDLSSIRGYDHMLFYQDVQNRTECFYPKLNNEQQAQYVLQCLAHLFLACDKTHPLISGTASADNFYLSMGASSVFYDMSLEDEKECIRLKNEAIKFFKEKGDADRMGIDRMLISKDEYSPSKYFQKLNPEPLDFDEINPHRPSPHPIYDFLAKKLKRRYYNTYLRFFPVRFYHKIVAQVEEKTKDKLEEIAKDSKVKFEDASIRLPKRIGNLLSDIKAADGGLPFIVAALKDMQAKLSDNRTEIYPYIKFNLWDKVEKDVEKEKIDDPFTDYHDAYKEDLREENEGANCEKLKKEAKNKLENLLSGEMTILSAIAHSFFAGIIFVLSLYPILVFLSPDTVNLGEIEKYRYFWVLLLFFLPSFIYLGKYFWYKHKLAKIIIVLKAYYLHDAYARIANRISSEINRFYDKLIALCDAYLNRCELIRKEVLTESLDGIVQKNELPVTMFNQPLAGGIFGEEKLLPPEKNEDSEVKVNYIRKKTNSLQKSDFYLLINQFHNDFEILFSGIYLTENFKQRMNDQGEEELMTKVQQEEEIKKRWEQNKKDFHKEFTSSIRSIMIERPNPTISDKVLAYSRAANRSDILEPVINYAASNGEITSTADTEFADVKANKDEIQSLSQRFLSIANTKYQIEKWDHFYMKYIFVTRWRSFDHFSLNRILPTEDFDANIRSLRVYEVNKSEGENEDFSIKEILSSIALWALCPDDTSSEWFRLINAKHFNEAFNARETFRKTLNQND